MKASAIADEITSINHEIDVLMQIRTRLERLHTDTTEAPEPKVRKTRKRKGLPSAEPPASAANFKL